MSGAPHIYFYQFYFLFFINIVIIIAQFSKAMDEH